MLNLTFTKIHDYSDYYINIIKINNSAKIILIPVPSLVHKFGTVKRQSTQHMKVGTMEKNIDKDCLFCKIINQEIPSYKIYENDYVYAFLDAYPNSDGHALVIPKTHCSNLMTCDNRSLQEVMIAAKVVSQKIQKALQPKGFNYVSNLGSLAYQVVMHFHIHIIPKYSKHYGYLLHRKPNMQKTIPEVLHLISKVG